MATILMVYSNLFYIYNGLSNIRKPDFIAPFSMETKYSQKLNYFDYEYAFNSKLLKKFEEGQLNSFEMETMRGLVYGYTFTEDYAKGIIPDAFSMDYWASKKVGLFDNNPQEQLLFDAISSTGEGLSQEDAICVICVKHEYEYINREWGLKIKGQKLLRDKMIDCIEFEEGQMIDKLYFDISRWFERRKLSKTNDKKDIFTKHNNYERRTIQHYTGL